MENNLIKKIFWTQNLNKLEEITHFKEQMIKSCQSLENEGFGFLEDATNPGKIDPSCSVVCPDGTIYTPDQISSYLIKRKAAFSSENPEDMKMHKINMYYFSFKE